MASNGRPKTAAERPREKVIRERRELAERRAQVAAATEEDKGLPSLPSLPHSLSHAAELSKVKQVAATADKLRREKWRVEESQRIKEATELNEVERSERSTQEKLNTTKQQLGELEGELARVRSLLRQKEEEVRQVREVASKLSRERDNMTDVVRQEFADRLVTTEEEIRQLKIEMSELRARQRLEFAYVISMLEQERAQRERKERELEEVHSRVRQALAKKEENLASLRSQHEAALKRAEHLEMLLERQRRELLK